MEAKKKEIQDLIEKNTGKGVLSEDAPHGQIFLMVVSFQQKELEN